MGTRQEHTIDRITVITQASAFVHPVRDRWPVPLSALCAASGWGRWAELPAAGVDLLFADDRSHHVSRLPLDIHLVDPLGTAAHTWLTAVGVTATLHPTAGRPLQQVRSDIAAAATGPVAWLLEHGSMGVASAMWARDNDVIRVPYDPLIGVTRPELARIVRLQVVTT